MNNMSQTVEDIAKRVFRVETLETRRSDRLDFYDVGIWNIKTGLEEAYKSGGHPYKALLQEFIDSVCHSDACGTHYTCSQCKLRNKARQLIRTQP